MGEEEKEDEGFSGDWEIAREIEEGIRQEGFPTFPEIVNKPEKGSRKDNEHEGETAGTKDENTSVTNGNHSPGKPSIRRQGKN